MFCVALSSTTRANVALYNDCISITSSAVLKTLPEDSYNYLTRADIQQAVDDLRKDGNCGEAYYNNQSDSKYLLTHLIRQAQFKLLSSPLYIQRADLQSRPLTPTLSLQIKLKTQLIRDPLTPVEPINLKTCQYQGTLDSLSQQYYLTCEIPTCLYQKLITTQTTSHPFRMSQITSACLEANRNIMSQQMRVANQLMITMGNEMMTQNFTSYAHDYFGSQWTQFTNTLQQFTTNLSTVVSRVSEGTAQCQQ